MTDTMIEKMARAAWLSVTGFDQWTDEEKALGEQTGFDAWNRWPHTGMSKDADDFRNAARAALLALRDGVDDDVFIAAWPDSRPGRPAMLLGQKRFRAVLNVILQEGEKA